MMVDEVKAEGGTGGSLGLLLMDPVMGGVPEGAAMAEMLDESCPLWLLLLPLLLSPAAAASVLTQLGRISCIVRHQTGTALFIKSVARKVLKVEFWDIPPLVGQ